MHNFFRLSLLAALTLLQPLSAEAPALILQITVDQLRGDLLERYREQLSPHGFGYLMDRGINYQNVHFSHSATETLPGHAVLATGCPPSVHGCIANMRYNRREKRMQSDLVDNNYALVGDVLSAPGISPLALLVPSFADELILSSDGNSKAFAISAKDRAAVPLAGYSGKAFWLSAQGANFVSSSYYFAELPTWARVWNASGHEIDYDATQWTLLRSPAEYRYAERDRQAWEGLALKEPSEFPHSFHELGSATFNQQIRYSPAADELTKSFAVALLDAERLGLRGATDYLSISFSSLDYVGHAYGPASLESEDCLLRLDKLLAELFAKVDQSVGLHRTLIVLSADHGVADAPEYVRIQGMPRVRIDPEAMISVSLQQRLSSRLGMQMAAIEYFYPPYVYLNYNNLAKAGVSIRRARRVLADELVRLPHVALAVTAEELQGNTAPESALLRQMRLSYHPQLSGDVYVVMEPHSLLMPEDLPLAASHGSPWKYDTYVPLLFGGMGLGAERVERLVRPVDVAVTLAAWMRIPAPAAATGSVLPEVIRYRAP